MINHVSYKNYDSEQNFMLVSNLTNKIAGNHEFRSSKTLKFLNCVVTCLIPKEFRTYRLPSTFIDAVDNT